METVLKRDISNRYFVNILIITALILLNLSLLKKSVWAQELIIEGTPLPALQNEFYRFIPKVSNAVGQTAFEGIRIPHWADFNTVTGEISSKTDMLYPLNDDVGLYEGIAIIVTDEAGQEATLGFSIEVKNINDSPQIYDLTENPIQSPLPNSTEHIEYDYEFLVIDPDLKNDANENLVIELIGAPSWLSIFTEAPDISTGTIKAHIIGTPGDEIPGNTYLFQISAVDNENVRVVTNPLELYVDNVNDEPVISGIPETQVNQGEKYSFIPDFEDLDLNLAEDFGDIINFTISFGADNQAPMPDWLSFNTETGELSSKQNRPDNDDVGLVENIIISISDGKPDNSPDASLPGFNICVKNVNDHPIITEILETPADGDVIQILEQETTLQGESFSMSLSASDIDLSLDQRQCNTIQDVFTFTGINIPPWLELIVDPENSLMATLVNIENRPNNNDVGPWQDIEIAVTDGQGGIDRLIFNLNVENQNDKPCFTQVPEQNIIVHEDQEINFLPLSADSGDDLICNLQTYVETGSDKTNIIKANDIDMKYGDQLYFSLVFPSEHESNLSQWLGITAVNTNDAELTGVPKNENVGIYTGIKLIVFDRLDENDPERKTAEYTFNLEVVNTNDPPVFDLVPPNDAPIEINAGEPWPGTNDQYALIHAYDVDIDDSVTYSLVSSSVPVWMTVNSNTGELTGTPANIHAGTNTIMLTAEDENGAKDQYTFNVKVNYVNSIPSIVIDDEHPLPPATIYEDSYLNHPITVTGIDDTLTYKLENAPSWLKLNKTADQNAVLSGTPLESDIGQNTGIKIIVTDSEGISDFIEFDIEVFEVNDKPIINGSLPTAVVGRDYYHTPWYYDEEENNICFRMNPQLEWLSIDENTGLLTGMPFKSHIGGQAITIYAYEDENCLPVAEIPFDKIFNNESQLGPVILKVIGLDVIVLPGDIDASGTTDLKDCILGLQILADIPLSISISKYSDLDGDRTIGLNEVIYILRKSAGFID